MGATTATVKSWIPAVKGGMSAGETPICEHVSCPEEEDAVPPEEVPCHRWSNSITSVGRRYIPRQRHSPSPPRSTAARRLGRSSQRHRSTSGGVARASAETRVREISAEGSAGHVSGGVSRGRARGGASAWSPFISQQEEPSPWQHTTQPEVSTRSAFELTNRSAPMVQASRGIKEVGVSQAG